MTDSPNTSEEGRVIPNATDEVVRLPFVYLLFGMNGHYLCVTPRVFNKKAHYWTIG